MGIMDWLLRNAFEAWLEDASHEELSEAYEVERQQWVRDGFGRGTAKKTEKMLQLDKELRKRMAEEWEKDPRRNYDPNYRWTDANRWEKE